MKKIIGAVVALIVVFVGLTIILSSAPISDDNIYGNEIDNDFEITQAEYDIDVAEDRSAQVTERITVMFLRNNKRGIIRDLPTNSGEQYYNISVEGDEYYVKSEGDFVSIYTGNDFIAKYDYGDSVELTIKYTIVPPAKTIGNTNYYMNIVPFGWATSQSDVTVNMSFPFDIKDIDVFMGSYGTTNELSSDKYSCEGSEFSLHTDKLPAYNGVTVDAELGRKFSGNLSLPGLLAIIISIVVIIAAVCVKLFAVKDRTVFPVINANPPRDNDKELDPAEVGYLIDHNCEPKDITALIFYFASKGLLELKDDGDGEFTLIKTAEIDPQAPTHQKTIFNGLFKNRDEVKTSQLKDKFYGKIALASTEIKRAHSKLSEKSAKAASILTAVIGVAVIVAIIALMMIRVNPTVIIRGGFIFFVIPIVATVLGYMCGRYIFNNKHKRSLNKSLRDSCISAIVIMVIAAFVSFFFFGGIFPYYAKVVLIVAAAVLGFIGGLIGRKTEHYTALMNEITGFKQFLETAEKDRLEAMLEENPQYYYDILPYANVLGVSDKWEDKFKDLENVPPPTYYYGGPDIFDLMLFNAMFRNSFTTFTTAMVSRPSSSSYSGGGGHFGGGGGFGGGFGGGGFGGGGGRSR